MNDQIPRSTELEPIGKRIAYLRSEMGWTQQYLATRLGISRVAVSHIEMDISIPSERTITLLAGLFKRSPHELVEKSTYPKAKAEKLPTTACCFTQLEQDLALLENDLRWLVYLRGIHFDAALETKIREKWLARLAVYKDEYLDDDEIKLISIAEENLNRMNI